jgi:hypothetical protein
MRTEFERPLMPFGKRSGAVAGLKLVEGEGGAEIPAFGGVDWTVQTHRDSSRLLPHITRVKLTAVLANGTRVQTKWAHKPQPHTWGIPGFQNLLDEMPEYPRQLSFDDLPESDCNALTGLSSVEAADAPTYGAGCRRGSYTTAVYSSLGLPT